MDFTQYINAELLILVPVLYFVGMGLKKAAWFKDTMIPAILGCCGVVLSLLWVLATSTLTSWQDGVLAAFTAIVQGILCAGASVYINQIAKQATKDN